MAFDTFLFFDQSSDPKVEGETQDATYKDKKAMEIYSFSFGASNPVTIGSATEGAGAGKVSISSFNIMKKSDNASTSLFTACCKGTHFPTATVVLRKAGGSQLEYLKYIFSEVFIESIQWSGSSGGDDTPSESVSLAFGKVNIEYKAQTVKGGAESKTMTAVWDLRANKMQ